MQTLVKAHVAEAKLCQAGQGGTPCGRADASRSRPEGPLRTAVLLKRRLEQVRRIASSHPFSVCAVVFSTWAQSQSAGHLGGTRAIRPIPLVYRWVTARDSRQEAGGGGTRTQVPFIVLVSGLRIFVGSWGWGGGERERICSTCLSLYEICVLLGLRGAR